MKTLAKLAIALSIGSAIVLYAWWRYPGDLWLATIPWAVLIAVIWLAGTSR